VVRSGNSLARRIAGVLIHSSCCSLNSPPRTGAAYLVPEISGLVLSFSFQRSHDDKRPSESN
jgi:hypothetical protein